MAEETLFTDIINNLGKAKKEGKISGGYRYKDGKLNIGGGYYGDDSMLEIDVNKDGGNILFKKRFKDGGSTNGSGDKAFTGKVKELMDDGYEFGEAVKEAMRQGYKNGGNVALMEASIQKMYADHGQAVVDAESLLKYKKSVRDLTEDQRGNLKRRLQKYKSFIKENNRMPNETEARKLGRKDKAITDSVGKDGKGVTEESIRENMINKGKVVRMVQGKVIFADPIKQQQFVEELTKRYALSKNSTKSKKANVLSNKDFYDKFFKGYYSESSVRTVIDRFKKNMDLEYNKLSLSEKNISKLNRIADEIISQGGKRISGTKTSPAHHLFPLGDEYVKANARNFAIIDQKTNSAMQSYNKTLKNLVNDRQQIIKDKIDNKITIEQFNTKNNKIDERATKVINRYNKNNPKNEGLLNWRKLSMINNNEVVRGKAIGGDYKRHTLDPNNKTLIEDLSKEDLRKYRESLKKTAKLNDLKQIKGVTTADKIEQPEKSKIRSMFDKFNVANVYKNVRPGIDKFTTMFPGKADNAIAAAIDFPMMYMSGLPLPAAAASSASMFLNKPNLGKGINIALESAALTDEERFLKKANERREGIESVLRNAPGKVKKYLTQGEKATYQNIEDYLPDEDLSGILSVKGVQ